jgi:hypothetical protein
MATEGEQSLIQFDGGALVCDMLAGASAAHTLQLSQYPVEDGTTISDHAIHDPETLTLTLVQTETPISVEPGFTVQSNEVPQLVHANGKQSTTINVRQKDGIPVNVNQLIGFAGRAIFGSANSVRIEGLKTDLPSTVRGLAVNALTANAPVERVDAFYSSLLALFDTVTPLTVTFKGRSFPDMVLTSVTRTDTQGQNGATRFEVALQRVRTVITQTVALPPVPEATRKVSRGAKPGEAPKPERRKSVAKSIGQGGIDALLGGGTQ